MKRKTLSSVEEQLCLTALTLFARQGWETTTLDQIIDACGKNPTVDRIHTKNDLILLVVEWVDQQAAPSDSFDASTPPEDRLFDLLMLRFEAMQPYKKGICAIAEACRRSSDLAALMYAAQKRTMASILANAGIVRQNRQPSTLQTHLLLGIYHYTFLCWQRESAGQMDQTMARLNNTLHAYNLNIFFHD